MAANLPPLPISESHELSGGPFGDGITRIAWHPDANRMTLCVASWDNTVRIWNLQQQSPFMGATGANTFASHPLMMLKQSAPILDACFSKDMLFAGGCENTVKAYDLNGGGTQAGQIVAKHDKPICRVRWCQQHNLVVTGGWDGHVKMWDGKNSNPVLDHTIGKVVGLDLKFPWLAAVDINRTVYVWNLQKNSPEPYQVQTSLRMQMRDINLFPNIGRSGFGVGSIEGRCNIVYLDGKDTNSANTTNDFAFRCHRQSVGGTEHIYAVNAIDFNPRYGTFVTGGGDGLVHLWDKDNKHKIRSFDPLPSPIVDARFHPGGNIVAYAVSYEWHKGYDVASINSSPNKAYVHLLADEDVKPQKLVQKK